MLLFSLLAEEAAAPLVMPNWAFPLIAAGIFTLLGFITWSFRDVSNRHSNKTAGSSDHSDAGHGQH
jgi:hypothetical protein